MALANLYNPFQQFEFTPTKCFLSGKALKSTEESIQVFPVWMMKAFQLEDKPFKMLDENIVTYKSLKLPCCMEVAEAIEQMELQVEHAFEIGYEAVKELDPVTLFQWMAKILYGVVYNEIVAGIRQQHAMGEAMNFSQLLAQRFTNLHAMLQSVYIPMEFENGLPFSLVVVPVENAQETFMYRDEINTLIFSLRMNDFGVIACLQDNGTNKIYHEDTLGLIAGKNLHPIQFEELCARFFYSVYLFNRLPEYTYMNTPQKVYVEPMPLMDLFMKPIFDDWQFKTYGQVLENFWKPWGYTLFEIIKDPEHPMSFISDREGAFVEHITLPKF